MERESIKGVVEREGIRSVVEREREDKECRGERG